MRTVIIGGGLLGLSSAIVLQERGVDTELLEAREDVGQETSRANGGLLTASMSDPWNNPGVHRQLATSLFDPRSPMKLRFWAIPSIFFWGLKFLRNSSAAHYAEATVANYQLAAYSIQQTRALRDRLGLRYDAAGGGAMKLFRHKAAMAGPRALAERLAPHGLRYQELDAEGAIAREPQLASIGDHIAGALFFPDDERGDAFLFCQELARKVRQGGGLLRTGVTVRRLVVGDGRMQGVVTDRGLIRAEQVVVAAGNWSPALLRTVGLFLPVKPVKGYTLTATTDGQELPAIPVIDDQLHAAVVPMGRRLRVAGTAEFAGFDTRIRQERVDNLFALLEALYPEIAPRIDRAKVEPWAGLRPVSCDGKPFIGPTRTRGLYVNTGHGHLGWTLAVGSAYLLSDLILGRATAIDANPFRATR